MKDFTGKVAVVTGAASGIGRALAERCAQEGMKVVLADIEEEALASAEEGIKALGVETLAVKTDVSQAEDVKTLAEKTIEAFGGVHLLCNNAGVRAGATSWQTTLADWRWVLGVDLWGVIHGLHYFVPIMIEQGGECHIINTASVSGLFTYPYDATYVVSKHGVVALTEALYRELKMEGHDIGVSVLCPGDVRTNLIDSERHRPIHLRNASGDDGVDMSNPRVRLAVKLAREAVAGGMPPEQVADITFAGIQEKRFYILPHTGMYQPLIKARLKGILRQRNPSFTSLIFYFIKKRLAGLVTPLKRRRL